MNYSLNALQISKRLLLTFFLIFAFQMPALAAVVSSVKGKTVKISRQRTEIKKGETIAIYDKKGRVTGQALVTWVGSRTAKATLLPNSKAKKGYRVKVSTARKSRNFVKGESNSKALGKSMIGVIAGYTITDMQVTLEGGSTVDMGGNGYGIKGIYDYALFNDLWLRGMVGYENFAAGGVNNAGCIGGAECNVNINYITMDLWGRYVIMNGKFRPWLGLGLAFLIPMSKTSTAIKDSSISYTSVFGGGMGFDWMLSDRSAIPVHLEYGLIGGLPSNDTVKTNYIAIRGGYSYSF